jgi:O-6-methylguanine DNA methyltransferase
MKEQAVYYTEIKLPSGESWTVLATEQGICRILYPQQQVEEVIPWLMRWISSNKWVREEKLFKAWGVRERLMAYFAGKDAVLDDLPLDLWGTEFQRKVWAELRRIPYGTTCSYSEIASAIGSPSAIRAVGAANGANPVPVIVPCHRVISRDRKLTGYRGGLSMKQRLLQLEGVEEVNPHGHSRFGF